MSDRQRLERAGELGVLRLMLAYDCFFRLLEQPQLLEIVDATVSETAILHLQNGLMLPPLEADAPDVFQLRFHRDFPRVLNGYLMSVNVFVAVDEFTEENGGTLVVPGTHQSEAAPSEEYMRANSVSVVCPAGSLLVFDSTVMHAAGSNRSNRDRLAINHQFTRSYVKPQIDYVRALGNEAVLAQPAQLNSSLGGTRASSRRSTSITSLRRSGSTAVDRDSSAQASVALSIVIPVYGCARLPSTSSYRRRARETAGRGWASSHEIVLRRRPQPGRRLAAAGVARRGRLRRCTPACDPAEPELRPAGRRHRRPRTSCRGKLRRSIMDCDLEDPPETDPATSAVKGRSRGYEIVFGSRRIARAPVRVPPRRLLGPTTSSALNLFARSRRSTARSGSLLPHPRGSVADALPPGRRPAAATTCFVLNWLGYRHAPR